MSPGVTYSVSHAVIIISVERSDPSLGLIFLFHLSHLFQSASSFMIFLFINPSQLSLCYCHTPNPHSFTLSWRTLENVPLLLRSPYLTVSPSQDMSSSISVNAKTNKFKKKKIQIEFNLTCTAKVPKTIEQKMGLANIPSKTFLSPWILRALISLNSCMRTNVLKMMV